MLADLAADKFDIASGDGRTLDRGGRHVFEPYMRYGKLLLIRSADQGVQDAADLDRPGLKIGYNRGG